MKRSQGISAFLVATCVWSSLMSFPLTASAAGCVSGQLIRGSNPSVYYCGADGKRYVFANLKTYNTWYSDFSTVHTITDAALASVPLGGNVTYKPGTRLVKITTDPTVYAVDQGGVLHAIASESVATQLYGSAWNKSVDDIPDAFFVNYHVGAAITSASQFARSSVMSAATSINADRGLAAAGTFDTPVIRPSGTPTVTLGLSPSVTTLQSGQSTTVTVSVSDPNGISTASLFMNGEPLKTCSQNGLPTTATCSATLYGGDYADQTPLALYGQEVNGNATRVISPTTSIRTSGGSTAAASSVSLSFTSNSGSSDLTTLNAGQSMTVTATANDSAGISSVSVFVNGALVQNCGQSGVNANATCSATIYGSNYPSGSSVAVYGQEVNQNGVPTISAASTLSVVNGSSASGYVTLAFSPNATTLAIGDTMNVSVSASGVMLGITDFSIFVNGKRVQDCSAPGVNRSGTCTATIYGSNYSSGSAISVYGQVSDTEGTLTVSPTSSLTITAGTSTSSNLSLSFSPYATSLAAGQSTTVTVLASDSAAISSISIYVNNALAHTCNLSGTKTAEICSVALSGSNYPTGSTVSVYAQESNVSGGSSLSTTSTLTISSATAGSGTVSLFLSPVVSAISGTQTVTVTVIAYDPTGLASVNVFVNGANVHACNQSGIWPTGASCSYVISAGNYASGTSLSIYGQGVNTSGLATKSTTSPLAVN